MNEIAPTAYAHMNLAVDNRQPPSNATPAPPPAAPAGMTPAEAVAMLERMGEIDLRMGVNGIKPTGYRSNMPQYLSEYKDKLDWNDTPMRLAWPTSREIVWAEKVSDLLTKHMTNDVSRRIVRARSLVHPLTGKHMHSWERIAALVDMHHSSVQERFTRAIGNWAKLVTAPSQ